MTVAQITDKTGLSLGLLVTLAGMLAAGVGTFAKTQSDVSRLSEKVESLEESRKQDSATHIQTELRLQRSEDSYAQIVKTLGKIEAQLDRLTVIRPVRGVP